MKDMEDENDDKVMWRITWDEAGGLGIRTKIEPMAVTLD